VLTDTGTPGSPGWWLLRLGERLAAQAGDLETLQQYSVGDHPLPVGHRKARDAYRRFQRVARTNFVGLVADAPLERLEVQAFAGGAQADLVHDAGAWRIWQANSLDADAEIVHRYAAVMRRGYVIVGPPDATDPEMPPDVPIITPEDPRLVIHESDPARRRRVRAALKAFADPIEGIGRAIVYLPDAIYYYSTAQPVDTTVAWTAQAWAVDEQRVPDGVAPNPLGIVPVVPFINRPDIDPYGVGEFETVTDVQDRINQTILDRLVIASMQAFRQRWVAGLSGEDQNGNPIFDADPGADLLWVVDNPAVKFGDFATTDIAPLLKAVEADVQHLAAITHTPASYLMATMVNVSGDALEAAEAGFVSKIGRAQRQLGESWEQVLRLAGRYGTVAVNPDAEVRWVPARQAGISQLADAAVKHEMAGVPWRQRMLDLGYSPQQIDRMDAERMQDALLAEKLGAISTTAPASINPDVGDFAPPKPRAT
jgi:hypothetical protein